MAGRKKGTPKTGGRKKGVTNVISADVKNMVLGAVNAKGGQAYLERQADENPVAFMSLLGKILPMNVNATGDVNIHWPIPRTKLDE